MEFIMEFKYKSILILVQMLYHYIKFVHLSECTRYLVGKAAMVYGSPNTANYTSAN